MRCHLGHILIACLRKENQNDPKYQQAVGVGLFMKHKQSTMEIHDIDDSSSSSSSSSSSDDDGSSS